MFRTVGVDNVEWMGTVVASNVYSSYITDFTMFQHSATLYEMHCRWLWQLWAFVGCVAPLIVWIVVYHVRLAARTGVLVPISLTRNCSHGNRQIYWNF